MNKPIRFRLFIFITGIILTLLGTIQMYEYQAKQREKSFNNLVTKLNLQLSLHIEDNNHILESVTHLYKASSHVSRNQFAIFTKKLLEDNSYVQAIEWVPIVLDIDRKKYEEQAARDGFPKFGFTERKSQGEIFFL